VYPESDDELQEESDFDLQSDAVPEPVGIYERPKRSGMAGLPVVTIAIALLLIVVAYLILTVLF
jgi:hypothetical protein